MTDYFVIHSMARSKEAIVSDVNSTFVQVVPSLAQQATYKIVLIYHPSLMIMRTLISSR